MAFIFVKCKNTIMFRNLCDSIDDFSRCSEPFQKPAGPHKFRNSSSCGVASKKCGSRQIYCMKFF